MTEKGFGNKNVDLEKQLQLDREGAAEFLRNLADAIEDQDQINLEFEEEKLIQPIGEKLPMRIVQDEDGLEIGFRVLNPDQ